MLNGQKIKNSLTLLLDLDSQNLEKNQSKELLDSKEHQLTQEPNSNHISKHLQWSQMLHSILKQEKPFMKIKQLVNG